MAIAPIGQKNDGDRKTPTLRQYIKENDGRHPIQSNVKVVFKPNKYGGYTFITDHNFKVQLETGSATNGLIDVGIDGFREDESTLVVIPEVDGKKVSFSIGLDTDQNSTWEEFDWGWKCSLLSPKNQTGKKKQSPRREAPGKDVTSVN